jgi:hypothetical protein
MPLTVAAIARFYVGRVFTGVLEAQHVHRDQVRGIDVGDFAA